MPETQSAHESDFFEPLEALTVAEAQHLIDRYGVLRNCCVFGEPGEVLILSRPGISITGSVLHLAGALVGILVRNAKSPEITEAKCVCSVMIEADGVQIHDSSISGTRSMHAPSCVVLIHGSVVDTVIADSEISGCSASTVSTACAPVDGLHVVGVATEVDIAGSSLRGNSGAGLVAAEGADVRAVGSRFERNGMQGIVCVGEDSVVELHDSVEITRNRGAGIATSSGGRVVAARGAPLLRGNGGGPWAAGSAVEGAVGRFNGLAALLRQTVGRMLGALGIVGQTEADMHLRDLAEYGGQQSSTRGTT